MGLGKACWKCWIKQAEKLLQVTQTEKAEVTQTTPQEEKSINI